MHLKDGAQPKVRRSSVGTSISIEVDSTKILHFTHEREAIAWVESVRMQIEGSRR